MMTPSTTTESDLADRLRLAVTRLARRLRQQSGVGASPTQVSALATVERRGPITLGSLAEAERVKPPTMTAAVTRLVADGLLAREVDESDRRIVRVTITPAGRKLLARNRSRKTAELERRLRRLSPEDRRTLDRGVAVLDRLLEEDPRP
ncbi:MAG: MarR family transcriptional regulator [Acidimicrobiia bacterium]|jgi:DNA-binding MarR family transcriptional regulator|nr:MarR family transcriptional regulator [Acidimicrobiia bacterium]